MGLSVLLCDTDSSYLSALTRYLLASCKGISVTTYCEVELFLRDDRQFDVAALTTPFLEVLEEGASSVRKLYHLCSSNEVWPADGAVSHSSTDGAVSHSSTDGAASYSSAGGAETLYKYQDMEKFLAKILGQEKDRSSEKQGSPRVLSVVSPIHHDMRLPFSLALSSQIGKRERVLFLDLDEESLLPEILQEGDRDLMDLMYEILSVPEQERQHVLDKYMGYSHGFYYLPTFRDGEQICYVKEEDWMAFWKSILSGGFDTIVVLYHQLFQGIWSLLGDSSAIYQISREGDFSKRSNDRFAHRLRSHEIHVPLSDLLLPMSSVKLQAGEYSAEDFTEGALGRFVEQHVGVS